MRRSLAAAAVIGTLALAACSDQSRESPTEPTTPSPALLDNCRTTKFPSARVSTLIFKVFPAGGLRNQAVARAAGIALLWDTCQASRAQKAAVDFVGFMNQNSAALIGTQDQRNTLINLVLNGVGVRATVPTESPGDFGVGFFDPTNKTDNTLIVTQNHTALVELEPESFDEPTTIVISRNADNFLLTGIDEEDQFPPYFDYNAINASGNHVLENNKTAIIAFCLLDPAYTYPDNRRIGHNPVAGAPGFPFEILEAVELTEEQAAALECENLNPNTTIIGGFGQGLPGLANAAWRTTKYYLGPIAESLLLPQALHAAILGTLPPPGGRASSLSPFGIVVANQVGLFSGDPTGEEFVVGEPLDTCSGDSCFPEFVVTDGESPIESSTNLTVTLLPLDGATGTLDGITTKATSRASETSPFTAVFDDLTISAPGTYELLVSAEGAAPYRTGTFTVVTAPILSAGVISNGTIMLGVNPAGNLIVLDAGPPAAVSGFEVASTNVGLRYVSTNAEALGTGILSEGWGVAHQATDLSGTANRFDPGSPVNLTVESFIRAETQAISVVQVGSALRVTHDFHPSIDKPGLYEIGVKIENISSEALSGVVYRRAMDWDTYPTDQEQIVTIVGTTSAPDVVATNKGYTSADPLVPVGLMGGEGVITAVGDFFDLGPFDHGTVFDVTLSTIFPGGNNTFILYYGAAPSLAAAKSAAVGMQAASFARANMEPFDGTPNTFLFGIGGIPGTPLTLTGMEPGNLQPTPGFTYSCDELSCDFTDTSTDSDGTIASRSWQFGDNQVSTGATPSHTYASSGVYKVFVTVTDNDGAITSTSHDIQVPPPVILLR